MSLLPSTLGRYLARSYFVNLLFMLGVLLGVVYLFDTVELLRRASNKADISFGTVMEMGLLKLPEVGQIVFPFAVLFSAIYTFWQLTRRYELVVIRSSGFSVWQFMAPLVAVAMIFGVLQIVMINPVGAMLVAKYERLESSYLTHRDNRIALFREGLWLRQMGDAGPIVIHAEKISNEEWLLKDVMALFFDHEDGFIKRIDAKSTKLKDGSWYFSDVVINQPGMPSAKLPELILATDLTVEEIEESFASPETMSFWRLPAFIRTMEATGFDATHLKIHYQSLLTRPLLFVAMIFLAASISLRPPRLRGTVTLIAMGVLIGFAIFFLSSFLQALGISHQIPVVLAAWAAPSITFLLGIAVILSLEDG